MRSVLYALAASAALVLAAPLAAQPALGELFFRDGAGSLPEDRVTLDDDSGAFEAESYDRVLAAQFPNSVLGARSTIRMGSQGPDADGLARLTISRDTLGRIRKATYELFAEEWHDGQLRGAPLQEILHTFDPAGATAIVVRESSAGPRGDHGMRVPFGQHLVFAQDQRLLSLQTRRLVPQSSGGAPGPAPIPVFASAEALRAALGLPPFDAMEWTPVWSGLDRTSPPAAPRPAPRPSAPPPPGEPSERASGHEAELDLEAAPAPPPAPAVPPSPPVGDGR